MKKRVADPESEKMMIVAEKSILASENTTDELAVLDLQDELADLLTKMTASTEEIDEEKSNFREAVNVGVEANNRVRSLEDVERTKKSLLKEWQAEVHSLNAYVYGRNNEIQALRRSEVEDRTALATLEGRRSEEVADGVLLEKACCSAMLLSDQTQGGWSYRWDKEIDGLVSCCMDDIRNTMTQADSATSCVLSLLMKLTKSVRGKRLLKSCDRYKHDWSVRRTEEAGYGGD